MSETKELTEKRMSAVQEIYESNQQLIYVSDRKVSALLLINAVLVSFSATWSLKEYAILSKVIILIGVVLAVLSTIMFLMAIIPRVTKRASESLLHYQGILGLTKEKYASKMLEIDDEEFDERLLGDHLCVDFDTEEKEPLSCNRMLLPHRFDLSPRPVIHYP